MLHVEVITTASLGDRSYIAHDGATAIIIDPQRDLDRFESFLVDHDLDLALVVETHIHNDYVSGGRALALRHNAEYALPSAAPVHFVRRPMRDGDEITVGDLTLRAISAPGHTSNHTAYLVTDNESRTVLFSGGSLLYGSVGRTDLVDPMRTEELTRAQYQTAQRLGALGDAVELFPTHGFGSFCSAGHMVSDSTSTIGHERERNDAFTVDTIDHFVNQLIAKLAAYPTYYAQMGPMNRNGAPELHLGLVTPVDPEELTKRLRAGEWVLDLRDAGSFAAWHLRSSISIPLDLQFSTYAGWVIPWGSPITLIAEDDAAILAAQRQLGRIGIDELAGAAVGTMEMLDLEQQNAHYQRITFAELPDPLDGTLVDVRRSDEFAAGHLPDATNLPLHEIIARHRELSAGRTYVHCASGYRASIGASLLARFGFEVIHIDDSFENAIELGLLPR